MLPALIAQGLSAWVALPLANGGVSNLIIWPSPECRQRRGALLVPGHAAARAWLCPRRGSCAPRSREQPAAACGAKKQPRTTWSLPRGFALASQEGEKDFSGLLQHSLCVCFGSGLICIGLLI